MKHQVLFCWMSSIVRRPLTVFCFLLSILCWPLTADATVKLPQLFQSGMVLQRGKPIPVWGKADANEQVTITFLKKTYTTTADANGNWRIDLPKQKAGGPYTLKVQGTGGDEQEFTDVLIGDVWLLSGQSNIDVHIERVYPQYVDEIEHFDNNQIRLFRVQNETDTHGVRDDIRPTSLNWKPLTKQNAWPFSAVGTFLGIRQFQETGVPQGIIVNSWGGTPIEAWISADSLQRDYPLLVEKTKLYQSDDFVKTQARANQLADQRWNELLEAQDPGVSGRFAATDCDDSSWPLVNQYSMEWAKTNGRGIVGSIWLRQHVTIDKAHAGQPARLLLGTLFDADITYVNGQQVGRTYYQYPPRRYDIPEGLLREGDNVITVRFINKYGIAHFIPQKPYMLCFGADRFSQNPMPQDVIILSEQWKHHAGASMPSCPSGDVSLQNLPTTLYNAVLHPLAPYAVSGVVWYQGESNTGNPAPYGDYLKKLIGCWRDLWQDAQMPFVIVQLANYDGRQQTGYPSPITTQMEPTNSGWASLREQQRLVAKADSYAELACIIDLGETVDIHPLRKKEVAQRIGLCFDRLVFKKKVQLSPDVIAAEVQGTNVVLTLDQPLRDGELFEFELAGADHRFQNATATVKGTKVTISSVIESPCFIRYAWKDNPVRANAFNMNGLPLVPFERKL